MKYDEANSEWVFSTGKRMYGHTDSLGLSADGDDVVYGSDGGFWNAFRGGLLKQELLELADELIRRAKKFKALVEARP